MSLLYILTILVIVGLILWGINTYVPMDPKIKKILNVAITIIVIVWLLSASGLLAYLGAAGI